jgi:hypothetical protein
MRISQAGRVVGATIMLFFGKKFLDEKGNVMQCIIMMQQSILLTLKFRTKCSHFEEWCLLGCYTMWLL